MAIATLNDAIAGMRPDQTYFKVGVAAEAIGLPHSHWYSTGRPGAATAGSAGVNGEALSSSSALVAGQIPHYNPGTGNAYLGRLSVTASTAGTYMLCDRLWQNSGLTVTSSAAQAITPATLPARDLDGTTNGNDVLFAIEWSAAGGAGTPTVTLTYTNEAGTTGHTGAFTAVTTPNAGTFEIFPLAAGDLGVRAPTSFQQSATRTSGTMHLVGFRILAQVEVTLAGVGNSIDFLSGGKVRLYDGVVPFIVQVPSVTTATNISGKYIETHG